MYGRYTLLYHDSKRQLFVYPFARTQAVIPTVTIWSKKFSIFPPHCRQNINKSSSWLPFLAIDTESVDIWWCNKSNMCSRCFFPAGCTKRVVPDFNYTTVSSILTRYFWSQIRFRNFFIISWSYYFLTDCIVAFVIRLKLVRVRADVFLRFKKSNTP